jgi:hypothetical protein
MELRKQIKEEVGRFLLEKYEGVNGINAVKFADALVAAGVIKDDYTDLSGLKSSSKLAYMIADMLKDSSNALEEGSEAPDISQAQAIFLRGWNIPVLRKEITNGKYYPMIIDVKSFNPGVMDVLEKGEFYWILKSCKDNDEYKIEVKYIANPKNFSLKNRKFCS